MDGWMNGWIDESMNNWRLYILLNSISIYQDDGQMFMKDCVQWNPVEDSERTANQFMFQLAQQVHDIKVTSD